MCQGGIDLHLQGEPPARPSTSSGRGRGRPCGPGAGGGWAPGVCGAWSRAAVSPSCAHALALFTMVANRLAEPLSKLACYAYWMAGASLPEAPPSRWTTCTWRWISSTPIGPSSATGFFRTADLFKADVDLIFWDTTSVYFEVDDEDTECETKRDTTLPPLRKRATTKKGAGTSRRW